MKNCLVHWNDISLMKMVTADAFKINSDEYCNGTVHHSVGAHVSISPTPFLEHQQFIAR